MAAQPFAGGPPTAAINRHGGRQTVSHRHPLTAFAAGAALLLVGCSANAGAGTTAQSTAAQAPSGAAGTEAPATPTPAPTPPPTPTPRPAPVALSGRGDDVVKLPDAVRGRPQLLVATHNGSSNFIVEELDAGNQTVGGPINEIGTFNGMVPFNFGSDTSAVALKVTADGAWTLRFEDVSYARAFDRAISGRGDEVVLFTGGSGVAAITHHGSANFIVNSYSADGTDLQDGLVNEIGAYDGKQPLQDGPTLLEIQADGTWTITLQ